MPLMVDKHVSAIDHAHKMGKKMGLPSGNLT